MACRFDWLPRASADVTATATHRVGDAIPSTIDAEMQSWFQRAFPRSDADGEVPWSTRQLCLDDAVTAIKADSILWQALVEVSRGE